MPGPLVWGDGCHKAGFQVYTAKRLRPPATLVLAMTKTQPHFRRGGGLEFDKQGKVAASKGEELLVDPFGGKSMSKSQSFLRPARSPVFRYGLAVLAVAIGLSIKLILLHFNFPYPVSASFLAVIAIAFWFGGTGPGVLSVLLSTMAFAYFVTLYQVDYQILLPDGSTKPVYLRASFTTTLAYIIYFFLVALLMSWFSSSRRRAELLLNHARGDLEVKVEERTADLRQANQQLRDEIAERKQAEQALHKAQGDLAHIGRVTTMGELVASIAHEVNQPLGAIVTNGSACVRLLSRATPDLDKSREIIGRMIKDGMRASEVIRRIRDLLHKATSDKTLLNINETVQEVIELVNSDLRRSNIKLLTELIADSPPVVGDRIQLQQVILNLILNARDAMNEVRTHSRELLITTKRGKSGDVMVAVRDSGKGLDPKEAERIFDPFFTTKAEGMGLGLSISRRIIEDHGGALWATANEGKGATMQFSLPPSNGRDS
jgi:signal transduction histidine kinase